MFWMSVGGGDTAPVTGGRRPPVELVLGVDVTGPETVSCVLAARNVARRGCRRGRSRRASPPPAG
jgi:hypothetical protein